MRKPADVAIDIPDDAIAEALSDHHLDEVAAMIERSHADDPLLETPIQRFARGVESPLVAAFSGSGGSSPRTATAR